MNPLSFVQRRSWLRYQLGGCPAAGHVAVALRMIGALEPGALALALRDVLARHDVLRSVVEVDGTGEPHQRVRPRFELPVPLTEVPLTGAAPHCAAVAEVVGRRFCLETELPVRAAVLRCAPGEHLLVLVVHRIAADQASLAVLAEELLAAYAFRSRGEEPRWGAVPAQYADHAARQRALLGSPSDPGSELARLAPYWREELGGLAGPLPLPADRTRPPEASLRGGTVAFVLEPELVDAAARLAALRGTSTPAVLRAALAVLLHQLGCGADLPIGSPVDTRRGAVPAGSLGPYTAIEVWRADLSGNPTFRQALSTVSACQPAMGDGPGPPFEYLAEVLATGRSLAYEPLCQVQFAWRAGAPPGAAELAGLTVTAEQVPTGTARCDLAFTFTSAAGGPLGEIRGEIEYATDLFDGATGTALAERYTRVLRQVTANPGVRVGRIDVLLPEERTLVAAIGGTGAAAAPATVPELIRPRVEAAPDAVAVVCGDRSLTYRQLWRRARRLAAELTAAGVGVESLVGLAVPRTENLVVAMLGVLMSGAAYVPIDPRYPSQRLGFLLADANPALLLTDTATRSELPGHGIPACLLDTLDLDQEPSPDPGAGAEPCVPLRPDNLAYVMYTSGSTGRPKGAGITHAAVVNGVTQLAGVVGLRPGALMLGATSVNFDVSVFEVVTALATGATVEIVRDILELNERGGWRGSVLHTVPSVFLDVIGNAGQAIRVGTAVFAGEALPATLVAQARRAIPGTRVVNAYGQTESFYATTFTVPDAWDGKNVPIGTPIGGMRGYVLNPALGIVPPGVTGELYVGGPVARGYHNQPALTAQRFVPDPFGPPGSRLYRTGDLARYHRAGYLELLGRTDTQLKIRGIRIEPAEIETVLASHPDIAQAVTALRPAAGRPTGSSAARLVAYLVPARPGLDLDARRLRRFVADRLPAFMIPASFVMLDRLPLTANGKLDHSRLPEPRPARSTRPGTDRERRLADLFAEVLRRDAVEVDDDFFAIGGDWPRAIHLLRRARAELGVDLPVHEFLRAPTVAAVDHYLTSCPVHR